MLRSDLRRCAQDYCTNCSGPLAAPGLYGALSGVRTQGYGDEVFVKHIADHMHTVKVSSSAWMLCALDALSLGALSLSSSLRAPCAGTR